MNKADGPSESDALLERQKQEYGRRGIVMTAFGDDIAAPYFLNLDEDEFRSECLCMFWIVMLQNLVKIFDQQILRLKHDSTVKRAGDECIGLWRG